MGFSKYLKSNLKHFLSLKVNNLWDHYYSHPSTHSQLFLDCDQWSLRAVYLNNFNMKVHHNYSFVSTTKIKRHLNFWQKSGCSQFDKTAAVAAYINKTTIWNNHDKARNAKITLLKAFPKKVGKLCTMPEKLELL